VGYSVDGSGSGMVDGRSGHGARTIFGRGVHLPGGAPAAPAPTAAVKPEPRPRPPEPSDAQDLDPALAALLLGSRPRLSRGQWALVSAAFALGTLLAVIGSRPGSSISAPTPRGAPAVTAPVLAPTPPRPAVLPRPAAPAPSRSVGDPTRGAVPRARAAPTRPPRPRSAPVGAPRKIDLDGPLPPSF
jgi:hypothetical protein